MKILTVDDSVTLRKIIAMSLTELGHTVVEAENGKVALGLLDSEMPGCIVLDINMPEMNGLEFLAEKFKNPKWKAIPVVVLTTQDETELRRQAVVLGANGFLAKPFKKEELLATLAQVAGL